MKNKDHCCREKCVNVAVGACPDCTDCTEYEECYGEEKDG